MTKIPTRVSQSDADAATATLKRYREQREAEARRLREHYEERVSRHAEYLTRMGIPDAIQWADREARNRKKHSPSCRMTAVEGRLFYLGQLEYSLKTILTAVTESDYRDLLANARLDDLPELK